MKRPTEASGVGIEIDALTTYLEGRLGGPVAVVSARPLVAKGESTDPKGLGYGVPVEVECLRAGVSRTFVVARTRPVEGFGHDYPADRAWQALYAHGAYNDFPRHVRSVDVGVIRASGELESVADAVEFFQLVEKAPGTLYWLDLERLLEAPPRALDGARARELARFLASVHASKTAQPAVYQRRIRELVGHGECLMGILDSYPHPYPLLPPADCEELERRAVGWRWRLRGRDHRLSRTHGDFHPWNLLFREDTDFAVLDRSRGEWGEPADDVAALAINYLFYSVRAREGAGGSAASQALLVIAE
ncbi:MAG TPA: phosphotransferase [Candidatus Limnocylindrales bacterium]|nr:phosphotransferase [Candidatus Limnocylindrales bacterium]